MSTLTIEEIQHAIDHAVHLLPSQGPLTVFIHHNTLHAFEELPFDEGIRVGAKTLNCRSLPPESWYRQAWKQGAFSTDDVEAALEESLGQEADLLVGLLGTRFHLRRELLHQPVQAVLPEELDWVIAETNAFEKFPGHVGVDLKRTMIAKTRRWALRHIDHVNGSPIPTAGLESERAELKRFIKKCDALRSRFRFDQVSSWSDETWESFTLHMLWQVCFRAVSRYPRWSEHAPFLRHRDALLQWKGVDADLLVHERLIPFCSAFLDQGLSQTMMPRREKGFWKAFSRIYGSRTEWLTPWLRPLHGELHRMEQQGMTALESIAASLSALGVTAEEASDYLAQTLLALRGFAGMIWQMETRPDRVSQPVPPGTLVEFLAIRLILDRLALQWLASQSDGDDVELPRLRAVAEQTLQRKSLGQIRSEAYAIFQLARGLGWYPETLFSMSPANWHKVLDEIRAFDEYQRCLVFQAAFERNWRQESFDAILDREADRAAESPAETPQVAARDENASSAPAPRYLFDMIACIDEREESFRRHLEEVEPRARTWGAAGFFGVAMFYQAAESFQAIPLCPIVIEPKHGVTEEIQGEDLAQAHERASRRRNLGEWQQRLHLHSRSFLSGILTSLVGLLAVVPLVMRVLFPRVTGLISRQFAGWFETSSKTQLNLQQQPEPTIHRRPGFSVDEMAEIIDRVLHDLGMVGDWSPLVIIVGHGSTSLNNPHGSAYNCGACGGGHGGPNARAFAQMANDPRVRSRLAERNLVIPADTWFVGAYHNTANDQVTFFDVETIPGWVQPRLVAARAALIEAARRNAHERCRRFMSAPLHLSVRDAVKHVQGRVEDLSQARPECGHATNAICIVGRRERTRGIFFDRRAFLHSYDPRVDDADLTILSRILAAVVPVCGGINLEYFFSYADPVRLGCSTKLPHNITSLLGVMDGAQSDLRTGLPWQMVEIHQPLRLLLIVEATEEGIRKVLAANRYFEQMVRNSWLQLALLDPQRPEIRRYVKGEFVLYQGSKTTRPRAETSSDWYSGKREDLRFARIGPVGNKIYDRHRSGVVHA